jgi:hypothetical protein
MSGEVEAPDVVGIVAGVRTWRVANTMWARMGGWLWSWGALACWRPPDIEEWKVAQCDLGHEEPPQDALVASTHSMHRRICTKSFREYRVGWTGPSRSQG